MATTSIVPTTVPTSLPTSLPTSVPTTVPTTLPLSVPTTAPTTVADPVEVALAALTRHDNVEKLWKENVTDANLFMKLFGLISYAFGKGAALKKDQAAIDFSSKATEAVQAIANRRFTPEEAQTLGLSAVTFTSTTEQLKDAQWKLDAQNKLEGFYTVFKTRVTQLGVDENSNDFGVYAAAAQKLIVSLSQSKEVLPKQIAPDTLKVKINSAKTEFNKKILGDMINAYASQPIEALTIEGYKAKVALIKGYFQGLDTIDIEAQLRQAVKSKHDTTQFDDIRGAYTDPSPTNAKVLEIKTAMQTKYTAEQNVLNTELTALRGPNGFDGTLNAAFQRKETALAELNTASTALQLVLQGLGQAANGVSVAALLTLVTSFLTGGAATGATTTVTQLQTLAQTLAAKQTEFTAAEQDLAAKTARFGQIAQYQPGTANIVGGLLANVNANLQPVALDNAARAEANKIASFFNELNMVVGENNKAVRRTAMRTIIGN